MRRAQSRKFVDIAVFILSRSISVNTMNLASGQESYMGFIARSKCANIKISRGERELFMFT